MFRMILAIAISTATLASAAEPKPAIVLQTRNFAKLFEELKHSIRAIQGENGVKALQAWFEDTLGDKQLKGLDQLRPWAGYVLPSNKFHESAIMIYIPINDEGDFLDLLDRIDLTAEEVNGKAGLYELESPVEGTYLRFHEKYAMIGINATEEMMDSKKLLSPKSLIDLDDLSPLSLTINPELLTKAWCDEALDMISSVSILSLDMIEMPKSLVWLMFIESMQEWTEWKKDLKSVRYTVDYRRDQSEFVIDWIATPKKDTEFAKKLADVKLQNRRFAAIQGNALTANLNYSQLNKQIKQQFILLSTALSQSPDSDISSPVLNAIKNEVLLQLKLTVEKKSLDVAIAIDGPKQDQYYEATVALGLNDAPKLETALMKIAAGNWELEDRAETEALKKAISVNATKIGEINIHTIKAGKFLSKEWSNLVGKDTLVAMAFTKDAVYITLGTNAIGRMRSALAAKPIPAHSLAVTANPKLLTPLFDKFDMPTILGDSDKTLSLLSMVRSREGESLRVRTALNLKLFSPLFPHQ